MRMVVLIATMANFAVSWYIGPVYMNIFWCSVYIGLSFALWIAGIIIASPGEKT